MRLGQLRNILLIFAFLTFVAVGEVGSSVELVKNDEPADLSIPEIRNSETSKADLSKPEIKNDETPKADLGKPETKNEESLKADQSKPEIKNDETPKAGLDKPEIKNSETPKADLGKPEIKNEESLKADQSKPGVTINETLKSGPSKPEIKIPIVRTPIINKPIDATPIANRIPDNLLSNNPMVNSLKAQQRRWIELQGSLNRQYVYLMLEKTGKQAVAGYLFDGKGNHTYVYGEWLRGQLQVYDPSKKRLTILLYE